MKINEQLRKYRKLNKKTQLEIAEVLKMSRTGYASLEQGLAEPNIYIIIKLCQYYKITSDELIGYNSEK